MRQTAVWNVPATLKIFLARKKNRFVRMRVEEALQDSKLAMLRIS
jgi:hypothetical protein